MFELVIEASESFDRKTSKIVRHPEVRFTLEHSLLTISKWESIWEVPFLGKAKKTEQQLSSYVMIMSGDQITEFDLSRFTQRHYEQIRGFLDKKYSATYFAETKTTGSSSIITSELIYYWMTVNNIPFECETWPLARLMTLIRVAAIKNNPETQKSGKTNSSILSERAALNKKRREELGTTG